ncbi:phage shock protein A [Endozoicomonas sp. OPT23]|uniref:PspA/IM30 family protein n=1 Tax=Endozoicomonas sp. OPT23 TaxID=2072845 RepID=UPI00129BE363|nr:PspA/IM30 family protein [Endozoicomonas sp. OPT23]MRI32913.1 phage shock protein A [Endozoicomonas sp. OPT23]
MNILQKLMTLFRGSVREIGEAVVDANGTKIFEQEIVDAESQLKEARSSLTTVMAKAKQAERELEKLRAGQIEHEGYARSALSQGNEPLALEVAEKIAVLEAEIAEQATALDSYKEHAERLKAMILESEKQLKDYQRQLAMVKTTEQVQKTTAAISENFVAADSKMVTAKETLDRIKNKQQEYDDRLEAGKQLDAEMSGANLKNKLAEAGISGQKKQAEDILARLRDKEAIS